MVGGTAGRVGVTVALAVVVAYSGAPGSVWALLMVAKSVRVTRVMNENVTHMNVQVIFQIAIQKTFLFLLCVLNFCTCKSIY